MLVRGQVGEWRFHLAQDPDIDEMMGKGVLGHGGLGQDHVQPSPRLPLFRWRERFHVFDDLLKLLHVLQPLPVVLGSKCTQRAWDRDASLGPLACRRVSVAAGRHGSSRLCVTAGLRPRRPGVPLRLCGKVGALFRPG